MNSTAQVVLHIGTMKTGTTYLQQLLRRNVDLLAEDGVGFHPRNGEVGRAVLGLTKDPAIELEMGTWPVVAERARTSARRIELISNELLSVVWADVVPRVVASLRPAEVTVVITARDILRLLPSAWQNTVKHGSDWSFPTFVQSVRGDPDAPRSPYLRFWKHHDLAMIIDRWAGAVGPENVVVVPVPQPPAPPEQLWERFASVLDVDPRRYDTAQDRRSNLSMGFAETELLRQVNHELADQMDKETLRRLVLHDLANAVLRPLPEEASDRLRPSLSDDDRDWAVRRSRELADAVLASGVRVVGSIEDLVPPADASPAAPTGAPPAAATALAAASVVPPGIVRGVCALLMRIAELEGGGPAAPGEGRRRKRQK
jgi:hypothetical protein